MRLIDADALMDYCNSLKDKTIDANDIARFPTVGGWISVKDRMPEEEEDVLVARYWVDDKHKKTCYVEIAERIDENWASDSDEYKICRHYDPYAWMPLPKPPKEEDDGTEQHMP